MLGLGVIGVAFNSAIRGTIWELPKDLVLTDGPVTHEWIAAEALRVLCENFEFPMRGSYEGSVVPSDQLQQFGVDIRTEEDSMLRSRPDFRKMLIEPSMCMLANHLMQRKPKVFLPLDLPGALDNAHLITHKLSGLNLRYIRAYDAIGYSGYEDDDGNWVEAEYPRPPGFLTRFDVRFA